jgi:hypothetical protein
LHLTSAYDRFPWVAQFAPYIFTPHRGREGFKAGGQQIKRSSSGSPLARRFWRSLAIEPRSTGAAPSFAICKRPGVPDDSPSHFSSTGERVAFGRDGILASKVSLRIEDA